MPEEKFLAPEISLYKKPGWLDSEGMASHINWARRPRQIGQGVPDKLGKASQANWAWRPTVNGQGVPEKQGMMSPLGVQKTSPYLGTVWSGHSFPTGTQSVWEDRLWQPQTGSRTPANGNSIHGMSPSWATFSFSAQAKLQMRCQQDNVQGGPSAPFFQKAATEITMVAGTTYALPRSLSLHPCFRNQEETNLAWETIQEYLDVGAIKEIPLQQAKHLIPWFVIKKGEKLRLITNCKELNNYLEPKPFRLENWPEIFPYLRKGMWAAKIDLKHAYFHLQLADNLRHYMCIQVEQKVFQFQAACFGLSTLPQQWQSVMKVFLKKWRKQGILTWVYLDDILLIGNSPQAVQNHLQIMLKDLENSGMVVNQNKTQFVPTDLKRAFCRSRRKI